ncbi:MAG: site-2 protease family protein [Clostridia bacterium]|nr:site-2 protease family protein [Clostridia bacterium]
MVFSLLRSGASFTEIIIRLLVTIPVVLLSLSVHEWAHGWVSYKCGDPTAKNLGRLTINPLKHLDLFGALAMLLFGFGWAKPVLVNSRYYKHPKWQMALVASAGPISNLLIAFIATIISHLLLLIPSYASSVMTIALTGEVESFGAALMYIVFRMVAQLEMLNIYLAVFNLLPIPPLDGSRILFIFLPTKAYFSVMRYERYIQIALFVLLFAGALDVPLGWLANVIYTGMNNLVSLVV